jgi:hypothetical protein
MSKTRTRQAPAQVGTQRVATWFAGRRVAALCAVGLMLAACGDDPARRTEQRSNTGRVRGDAESLDNSRQTAVELLNGLTYEDARGRSACAGSCTSHNAGFAWARVHNIYARPACTGKDAAFIEGCQAYADEVERRAADVEVSKESE